MNRLIGLTGLFFVLLVGSAWAQMGAAPVVKVAEPLQDRVVDWDEYTGRFQAKQSVDVQARVSGYLSKIHFRDGELVVAGQLLYTIDQRPFELALLQAQARLAAAEASRDLALIEFERADELATRNVGAQSEAQRTGAAYQESLANVSLEQAQIASAQLDLEFTEIRSPIDGRISSTRADVGDLVVGGPSGASVLTSIVSVDPIEFEFTASEADFLKYARLNQTGERGTSRDNPNPIFVRLIDETTWERGGVMEFIDNRLDPNSGTILGRAVFDNADGFLQPGLFGRARLLGSGEYDALLIPDEAVVADQSRSIVYVVDSDNVVQARQITTGAIWKGMRIVRSGIDAQDRIIVSGLQRIRPGVEVATETETLSFNQAGLGE
ncbi:MAG: efflux RND transporter periplasmic adaptor subunit [Pseudomonadota bacterium]